MILLKHLSIILKSSELRGQTNIVETIVSVYFLTLVYTLTFIIKRNKIVEEEIHFDRLNITISETCFFEDTFCEISWSSIPFLNEVIYIHYRNDEAREEIIFERH